MASPISRAHFKASPTDVARTWKRGPSARIVAPPCWSCCKMGEMRRWGFVTTGQGGQCGCRRAWYRAKRVPPNEATRFTRLGRISTALRTYGIVSTACTYRTTRQSMWPSSLSFDVLCRHAGTGHRPDTHKARHGTRDNIFCFRDATSVWTEPWRANEGQQYEASPGTESVPYATLT